MSWKDRLLIKIMSNKLVIKIMSIPIVIKILTKLTQAFIWVTSLCKKKEAQTNEAQTSESENVPPEK